MPPAHGTAEPRPEWLRTVVAVALVGVVLALIALAIGSFTEASGTTLWLEAGKVCLTAIGAAVIGGLVKFLFDQFAQARETRAKRDDFVTSVIAEVDDTRLRVETARLLIRAQRTAKAYDEQMHDLIEASTRIEHLRRRVEAWAAAAPGPVRDNEKFLTGHFRKAHRYVQDLLDEYQAQYSIVAPAAKGDEVLVERRDGGGFFSSKGDGFPLLMNFLRMSGSTYDDEIVPECHRVMTVLYSILRQGSADVAPAAPADSDRDHA
jgi:hypothetical protein